MLVTPTLGDWRRRRRGTPWARRGDGAWQMALAMSRITVRPAAEGSALWIREQLVAGGGGMGGQSRGRVGPSSVAGVFFLGFTLLSSGPLWASLHSCFGFAAAAEGEAEARSSSAERAERSAVVRPLFRCAVCCLQACRADARGRMASTLSSRARARAEDFSRRFAACRTGTSTCSTTAGARWQLWRRAVLHAVASSSERWRWRRARTWDLGGVRGPEIREQSSDEVGKAQGGEEGEAANAARGQIKADSVWAARAYSSAQRKASAACGHSLPGSGLHAARWKSSLLALAEQRRSQRRDHEAEISSR